MRLLHTFDDGWTISWLETLDDLKAQDKAVHDGHSCLPVGGWVEKIKDGKFALLNLADAEGNARATLLWGEAGYITKARDCGKYVAYSGCQQFDQNPRIVENRSWISLQCCPPGYMAGDPGNTQEETKRTKLWYESLPQ